MGSLWPVVSAHWAATLNQHAVQQWEGMPNSWTVSGMEANGMEPEKQLALILPMLPCGSVAAPIKVVFDWRGFALRPTPSIPQAPERSRHPAMGNATLEAHESEPWLNDQVPDFRF